MTDGRLDLSRIDPNSPTWREMARYLDRERETLRQRLEGNGVDHPATQYLRGRIHQITDMLAVGAMPEPPAETRRAAPKGDIYA